MIAARGIKLNKAINHSVYSLRLPGVLVKS